MSTADMMSSVGELNDKVFDVPKAAACLNTMGQTSENVAAKFKISRDKQDQLAYESHAKALKVGRSRMRLHAFACVVTRSTQRRTRSCSRMSAYIHSLSKSRGRFVHVGRVRVRAGDQGRQVQG
jgi:acetyl-CoA acetyltransferase